LDLTSSSWNASEEDENNTLPDARTSVRGIRELLRSLPRNLHKDKQKAAAAASIMDESTPQDRGSLETLVEEEGDLASNAGDAGLINAWQYRIGHSTSRNTKKAASDIYCHSYDLHGYLNEQVNAVDAACLAVIAPCSCKAHLCSTHQCGFSYFCKLVRQVKLLLSETPRKVVRLLFYHSKPSTLQVALPLLLAHIRTHRLPVVVFIAVQPWTTPGAQRQLCLGRRASDVVLTAEGFSSRRDYPPPPEFRLFHGLLQVHKVSTVTAATAHGGGHFADATVSKRPTAHLYGLKRDRRKLHIELLHIPPEDYAQGGGSVGGGARSGAGRPGKAPASGGGCASSGGGGSSPLDF
jgi:uncharacterized membrane protein YgcG